MSLITLYPTSLPMKISLWWHILTPVNRQSLTISDYLAGIYVYQEEFFPNRWVSNATHKHTHTHTLTSFPRAYYIDSGFQTWQR